MIKNSFTKNISIPFICYEITQECNLHCDFCYNVWKSPFVKSFPSVKYKYSKAVKTLNKIFKHINPNIIAFTGGEPFLSNDLEDLVLQTKIKGKDVIIITNGTHFNENRYNKMLNLQVDCFELPILSYQPEVHDSLTNKQDSWKLAVESISFLKKKQAAVVIVIVVTKLNYKDVYQTLEFVRNLGINTVLLNRYNIGGNGINRKMNILPNKQEMNSAFCQANEFAMKYKHFKISSGVCTPHCIINPKDFPEIEIQKCPDSFIEKPITIKDIKDP